MIKKQLREKSSWPVSATGSPFKDNNPFSGRLMFIAHGEVKDDGGDKKPGSNNSDNDRNSQNLKATRNGFTQYLSDPAHHESQHVDAVTHDKKSNSLARSVYTRHSNSRADQMRHFRDQAFKMKNPNETSHHVQSETQISAENTFSSSQQLVESGSVQTDNKVTKDDLKHAPYQKREDAAERCKKCEKSPPHDKDILSDKDDIQNEMNNKMTDMVLHQYGDKCGASVRSYQAALRRMFKISCGFRPSGMKDYSQYILNHTQKHSKHSDVVRGEANELKETSNTAQNSDKHIYHVRREAIYRKGNAVPSYIIRVKREKVVGTREVSQVELQPRVKRRRGDIARMKQTLYKKQRSRSLTSIETRRLPCHASKSEENTSTFLPQVKNQNTSCVFRRGTRPILLHFADNSGQAGDDKKNKKEKPALRLIDHLEKQELVIHRDGNTQNNHEDLDADENDTQISSNVQDMKTGKQKHRSMVQRNVPYYFTDQQNFDSQLGRETTHRDNSKTLRHAQESIGLELFRDSFAIDGHVLECMDKTDVKRRAGNDPLQDESMRCTGNMETQGASKVVAEDGHQRSHVPFMPQNVSEKASDNVTSTAISQKVKAHKKSKTQGSTRGKLYKDKACQYSPPSGCISVGNNFSDYKYFDGSECTCKCHFRNMHTGLVNTNNHNRSSSLRHADEMSQRVTRVTTTVNYAAVGNTSDSTTETSEIASHSERLSLTSSNQRGNEIYFKRKVANSRSDECNMKRSPLSFCLDSKNENKDGTENVSMVGVKKRTRLDMDITQRPVSSPSKQSVSSESLASSVVMKNQNCSNQRSPYSNYSENNMMNELCFNSESEMNSSPPSAYGKSPMSRLRNMIEEVKNGCGVGVNKAGLTMDYDNPVQYVSAMDSASGLNTFIGEYLINLWRKQNLCDVEVKVEGHAFLVHKLVLAAYSDVFLPSNPQPPPIISFTVPNATPDAIEQIFSYIYTSNMELSEELLEPMLRAAIFMEIKDAVDIIVAILSKPPLDKVDIYMRILSCVGMSISVLDMPALYRDNFKHFITTDMFLRMSASELEVMLQDPDVMVTDEIEAIHAIARWIQYNYLERISFLAGLLRLVSFECISPQCIARAAEEYSFIFDTPGGSDFIAEAFKFHAIKQNENFVACHDGVIDEGSLHDTTNELRSSFQQQLKRFTTSGPNSQATPRAESIAPRTSILNYAGPSRPDSSENRRTKKSFVGRSSFTGTSPTVSRPASDLAFDMANPVWSVSRLDQRPSQTRGSGGLGQAQSFLNPLPRRSNGISERSPDNRASRSVRFSKRSFRNSTGNSGYNNNLWESRESSEEDELCFRGFRNNNAADEATISLINGKVVPNPTMSSSQRDEPYVDYSHDVHTGKMWSHCLDNNSSHSEIPKMVSNSKRKLPRKGKKSLNRNSCGVDNVRKISDVRARNETAKPHQRISAKGGNKVKRATYEDLLAETSCRCERRANPNHDRSPSTFIKGKVNKSTLQFIEDQAIQTSKTRAKLENEEPRPEYDTLSPEQWCGQLATSGMLKMYKPKTSGHKKRLEDSQSLLMLRHDDGVSAFQTYKSRVNEFF